MFSVSTGLSPFTTDHDHREGSLARAIEQQTARLPSDTFLWAAVGAMGISLAFQMAGKHKSSTFVGQWAPVLLLFGLYNKVVKVAGSDSTDRANPGRDR